MEFEQLKNKFRLNQVIRATPLCNPDLKEYILDIKKVRYMYHNNIVNSVYNIRVYCIPYIC